MSALASPPARAAVRLRVTGTVQGVGFRPFVYRLAQDLGLGGYVCNDAHGVVIEVEGAPGALDALALRLTAQAPPLARIERVDSEPCPVTGRASFEIRGSAADGRPDAAVAVDSATCADCLRELFDPRDRRYRYPFVNCTNCGPRFTIVRGVPYDRASTTMAAFVMCAECQAEYDNPGDRRFHAQPNACPRCGPSLMLTGPVGRFVAPDEGRANAAGAGSAPDDPVATAARALRAGAIVAVKGLGGYHVACRADSELAVATLRARKHREDKPFALMVADVAAAMRLVELGDAERELLTSPSRPIVLARRRPGAPVAASVAPASPELGLMLPYSPLHHLLLADAGVALVMTSANVSDEPIAYRDDDARTRLGAVADLMLSHNRPIETRTDDSVVRVVKAGPVAHPMVLRRSRGYVPATLALPGPEEHRPLLACGAELKNTFCLARDRHAWVSHHIGDLGNFETLTSFTEGIEHFARLFAVEPELVVHDLHPEYLSTKYAQERDGVQLIGVQHHHAHLAACLAEHGHGGPAVGAIFDGTGYGCDGTVWGGELLYGDLGAYERAGALRPVRMPGGTQAIREPWRMACAWLAEVTDGEPAIPGPLADRVQPRAWHRVLGLTRSGLASPVTSSMGRLFDAVAAIAGIRTEVSYEGQAAVELEACCDPAQRGAYPLDVVPDGGRLTLDPVSTLEAVLRDVKAGERPAAIAARFHAAVASATAQACADIAASRGTGTIVLAGGVFANRVLLERTAGTLMARGLRVLIPRALPPGDGAISYGQAAVAAAREAGR